AVTEAHHHFPAGELAAQPVGGTRGVVYFQHGVHDSFVRPAVQRTLERPDGRGTGAVEIGGRGGDNTGREGGGVEAVFRVQDERRFERLHDFHFRHAAETHVEEVFREAQVGARIKGRESVAAPEI